MFAENYVVNYLRNMRTKQCSDEITTPAPFWAKKWDLKREINSGTPRVQYCTVRYGYRTSTGSEWYFYIFLCIASLGLIPYNNISVYFK